MVSLLWLSLTLFQSMKTAISFLTSHLTVFKTLNFPIVFVYLSLEFILKWTIYNINLLSLFQAWFTSTQESAPMENPRKAPGHQRTRTSPPAPKIFHFPRAQTTPPWWSWDRSRTGGKSQTRRRSTRDSPFPLIWRSRRTSFLARQSRLPWRDLCQGGSGYLLDISLSPSRSSDYFSFHRFFFFVEDVKIWFTQENFIISI